MLFSAYKVSSIYNQQKYSSNNFGFHTENELCGPTFSIKQK